MSQFPNSLEIYAQLAVSFEGHEFSVKTDDGAGINIELPNLQTGWALFKQRPARRQRATLLNHLQTGLLACGSHLKFQIAGRTVATLGMGGPAGLSSTILGLQPLQLFPYQIILACGSSLSR